MVGRFDSAAVIHFLHRSAALPGSIDEVRQCLARVF